MEQSPGRVLPEGGQSLAVCYVQEHLVGDFVKLSDKLGPVDPICHPAQEAVAHVTPRQFWVALHALEIDPRVSQTCPSLWFRLVGPARNPTKRSRLQLRCYGRQNFTVSQSNFASPQGLHPRQLAQPRGFLRRSHLRRITLAFGGWWHGRAQPLPARCEFPSELYSLAEPSRSQTIAT